MKWQDIGDLELDENASLNGRAIVPICAERAGLIKAVLQPAAYNRRARAGQQARYKGNWQPVGATIDPAVLFIDPACNCLNPAAVC